jgi:two-component system chemotaxis response regulator CheY
MEPSAKPSMRVLIADDQRSVGTSLADLVRHCEHEIVAVVGSGVEAIQAYSLHHPDVVLMDYWMPKLNGATACRNIVAKDPTARVILVSGWSPGNGIVSDSGALALLPKPIDIDDLAAALNNVAQNLPFQSEIRTS